MQERIKNGETSILTDRVGNINNLTLSDIIEATNQEDTLCIEIVEEVSAKLGKYIAGLINIFNPELVIIGGQVAETDGFMMLPIRSAIRKHSLNLVNKDSHIELSKLKNKVKDFSCLDDILVPLTSDFWKEAESAIPDDWLSKDFEKIREHVVAIKENSAAFLEQIITLLS